MSALEMPSALSSRSTKTFESGFSSLNMVSIGRHESMITKQTCGRSANSSSADISSAAPQLIKMTNLVTCSKNWRSCVDRSRIHDVYIHADVTRYGAYLVLVRVGCLEVIDDLLVATDSRPAMRHKVILHQALQPYELTLGFMAHHGTYGHETVPRSLKLNAQPLASSILRAHTESASAADA
jgi:hypothetical protein